MIDVAFFDFDGTLSIGTDYDKIRRVRKGGANPYFDLTEPVWGMYEFCRELANGGTDLYCVSWCDDRYIGMKKEYVDKEYAGLFKGVFAVKFADEKFPFVDGLIADLSVPRERCLVVDDREDIITRFGSEGYKALSVVRFHNLYCAGGGGVDIGAL